MAEVANFTVDESGNITIAQGKSIAWAYEPLDADDLPVNITGWTARMQVRPTYDSSKVLLELTTEDGKIQNTGTTFVQNLIPADTAYVAAVFDEDGALVTPSAGVHVKGESLEAVYDYEMVNNSTSPPTVEQAARGSFTILREVTRA